MYCTRYLLGLFALFLSNTSSWAFRLKHSSIQRSESMTRSSRTVLHSSPKPSIPPQPRGKPQQETGITPAFTRREEGQVEFLMKELLFTPPVIDGLGILWVVTGQSILLNTAALAGFLLKVDILNFPAFSIDSSSLIAGVGGGVVLAVLGLIFDSIPSEFFQATSRDTKLYVLRLIGRNTKILPATIASVFISTGAAVAEETFFRGFLMQWLTSIFGLPLGLATSSALFGLAHYPVPGGNAFVEAVLGGAFGYLYFNSNGNIFVPIAAHAMYDFITIFATWLIASRKLRSQIKDNTFDGLCAAIYDIIDVNRDGLVDKNEFELGLRLLGYGPNRQLGRSQIAGAEELFKEFDVDKNQKIDLQEFIAGAKKYQRFSTSGMEGRSIWGN